MTAPGLGSIAGWMLGLALAAAPAAAAPPPPQDRELAAGIQLFRDGDFEGALVALDTCARRLAADPAARTDLTQAQIYLGATYTSMGQEPLAVAKFRQALQHDATLTLSADEFPVKVRRVFEQARASAAETSTLSREAARKKGKGPWLLVGGGLAAAGGAVAVLSRERDNRPPTGSFRIDPAGGAIADVTVMTFTASGSDPEGEPLSFDWDFGEDGIPQFIVGCPRERTASGATVRHVYCGSGTASVELAIKDGLTTTRVRQTVESRTLEGRWQPTSALPRPATSLNITSGRTILQGRVTFPGFEGTLSGSAANPRRVTFSMWEAPLPAAAGCLMQFEGEVDATLARMSGLVTCAPSPECGSCGGQSRQITFTR